MLYRAYDLAVESEIAIPGAPALAGAHTPALRIVLADFGARAAVASSGPYGLLADGAILFEAQGVARYRANPDGTLLEVQPAAGAQAEEVAALLIATALPMVLWRRGDLVLHAAAAILPGCRTALAFTGSSGSGKSTLLRQLLDAGSQVVGDDTLCLRASPASAQPARTGVRSSGLPACILLRTAVRQRESIPVPQARQTASTSLAAMLVPGTPAPSAAYAHRLRGPEALQAVLRALHRPRIPALLGVSASLFPRLAALTGSLELYSWNPTMETGLASRNLKFLQSVADEVDQRRRAVT